MAVDIQFLINGQDRGQPLNAKDFGVSITESVDINARIVTFDNELIFGNDMYTYLFDRLSDTGFCNLVEVEVDYECDGAWVKLTNGYIVVSECTFDLDKCQVKTKLYDDTFSTRINNNKSIPFSTALTTTKNGNIIVPPRIFLGKFFNPPTGEYDNNYVGVISVYEAFKHLVNCMSDGLVDFESSLFFWDINNDYPSTLILTNGIALRNRNLSETVISFEQLYIALKKKLNLGMVFERQANGRPLLRIELESYFYQSGVDVNLYDQPSIELNFDKERLYQAVNFGADPYLEAQECNNGTTSCTFIQTPFRGFRDETFGFTGECNTSAILDLKTDEVIFDTNVIEDIFRFNIDTYDTNPIIVDAHYYSTTLFFEMNPYNPYSLTIPQTVYNGNFRNIIVSSNWLNGYPNSLYSFLTTPFDPATTVFESEIDNSLPPQIFNANSTAYESYSNDIGLFLKFLNEVIDTGNNFNGTEYVVPEAGVYTFTFQLIRRGVPDPIVGNVTQFLTINQYSSDDVFIRNIAGSNITQPYTSFSLATVTGSFVCNQGDLIRVDWWAITQNGSSVDMIVEATFDGKDTFFKGSGVPFSPLNPDEVLDSVDQNDVRAYLYNFERPLTMAEIQLMLNNTSKPIAFGRHDDPLRVIEGFIKKVNVPSITRQKASIELKSNRLLR
jgi:hypothetical protein